MKVDKDYQSLLLSNDELSVLLDRFRDPANPLALHPITAFEESTKSEVIIDFDTMHKDFFELYDTAIKVFSDPFQLVEMCYTVAHHIMPRVLISWPANPNGGVGLLSFSAGGAALAYRPVGEVFETIKQALVLGQEISQDSLNLQVRAETLIVLMAAIEAARFNANRIPHEDGQEPVYAFKPEQVMDRLSDAGRDDLRWPLNLIEKLEPHIELPGLDAVEVERALLEWVREGLLEQNADQGANGSVRYRFIADGHQLVADWSTELSKIGLRVSVRLDDDDAVDQEVWLMLRTKRRLWLARFREGHGSLVSLEKQSVLEALQSTLHIVEHAVAMAA